MIRALALAIALAMPAAAQTVAEAPEEARIRALARELRCPVCQSESLLESRSSTAAEMLVIVREMVAEGRSDPEIVDFFRARYGDFVMLAPPSSGVGRLIWLLPVVLLAAGGVVLARALRSRGAGASPPEDAPGYDADRLERTGL